MRYLQNVQANGMTAEQLEQLKHHFLEQQRREQLAAQQAAAIKQQQQVGREGKMTHVEW